MSRREMGDGLYVQILGCGAAKPTVDHNPSAQAIRLRGKTFLVDCGEGTQQQMMRMGVPIADLHRIFISHLHGDHCLGLPGLISTMSLMNFDHSVHIYGPVGTEAMVEQVVRFFTRGEMQSDPRAVLEVHELAPTGRTLIYEDRSVRVSAFPLKHRVPCVGYRFDEQPLLPHLDRAEADRRGIPVAYFGAIKQGRDYVREDGSVVPATSVTFPAREPYSYAYCSDTVYREATAEYVRGVDLLYHEATFDHSMVELARERGHATAHEAALVAEAAGVGYLLLGHFSSRYTRETEQTILLSEAQEVFPRTLLAHEGLTLDLEKLREE